MIKEDLEECSVPGAEELEHSEKAGLLAGDHGDDGLEADLCHVEVDSSCHGGPRACYNLHGHC